MTDKCKLTGKFFHTFYDDGEHRIKGQGEVLTEMKPGFYLVQWFSWLSGCETNQELVKVDDMLGWEFYDHQEDWKYNGDLLSRVQDERLTREMESQRSR